MKKREKNNISEKNVEKSILLFFAVFIMFVFSCTAWSVYDRAFGKGMEIVLYRNENPINLEKILEENISLQMEEELIIEEIDVEYITTYVENAALPKGTIQVIHEGRDGRQNIFILKKYKDGEIVSEEIVSEKIIKDASNRVVEVGVGEGNNNYKAKVGDIVYVTANNLPLRTKPDKNSEKVSTILKDSDVKILQILDDWYFVEHRMKEGYIPSDCITSIQNVRRRQ